MRVALYEPDIPQNAGTLLRLGACLGVPVDVIGPTGFDISDRALRRSSLDYISYVELARHSSWAEFLALHRRSRARLVLLTTHARRAYLEFTFEPTDVLLVGRESAGVPDAVRDASDAQVVVPMRPGLRSLNVAVAAAIVLGEALRQTAGFPAP